MVFCTVFALAGHINQRVHCQPGSNAAGPSTSTVPASVDHFKNVTHNNGVAFKATENVSIQSYIDALIYVYYTC